MSKFVIQKHLASKKQDFLGNFDKGFIKNIGKIKKGSQKDENQI